ncbi:MAG TPA: NTP transferase domain-containing protein [Acidimicrobiales bacterium]|nr:NTP transferase domain-containing protein [Acidimicrobiales bacterium]
MGGLTAGDDGAAGRPVLVMLAAGMAKRYGGCKPLAPVGLHGEAVIDLNAGDGRRAGFGEIVLVLGPASGAAIAYHVRRVWPRSVPVSVAWQVFPLGTAHAVLGTRAVVGERPFAVINADDIYGVPALERLARHLGSTADHALVSYQLRDTVVSVDPVTRGTCLVDGEGWLRGLVERRRVTLQGDGRFIADDGLEPKELPGETPVSMNLWGFTAAIWPVLDEAVRRVHPDVDANGTVTGEAPSSDAEVLLPEVVGTIVSGAGTEAGTAAGRAGRRVRVLAGTGRCIGVTHADDLPVVRTELAEMVGQGLRAEAPWGAGS